MDASLGLSSDRLDVLIVGAGQAGLALAYNLRAAGLRYLIVDAASSVGETWSSRWDSLTLFTPTQYDSLPGMAFPGPRNTYPTKDEVASYLRSYATRFSLPVRLGEPVSALVRDDGGFLARVARDELRVDQVVAATGPFQVPIVPEISKGADPSLFQIHSTEYRNPEALPDGSVLVVGGGNSGCQIAGELAASRRVELAVGRRVPVVPQRTLGRDIWWWGTKLGIDRVPIESTLGKRLSRRDPVIGTGPRGLSKRFGIRLRPRVDRIRGTTVSFADGTTSVPDSIVWATGFRSDYSWIDVPRALDARGRPIQRRGVSRAPGLHFLGLNWLWTRGSGLLGWVGHDAAYLSRRIVASIEARASSSLGQER